MRRARLVVRNGHLPEREVVGERVRFQFVSHGFGTGTRGALPVDSAQVYASGSQVDALIPALTSKGSRPEISAKH